MFSISKLKHQARSKLRGHRGSPMLLTLVIGLINAAIAIPGYVFNNNRILAYFSSLEASTPYIDNLFSISDFTTLLRPMYSFSTLLWAITLITFIINNSISIAIARFYLGMMIDPEKTKFNTFVEGLVYWGKGILAALWKGVWLWLWGLLFIAIFIGIVIIFSVFTAATGGFKPAIPRFNTITPAVLIFIGLTVVWYITFIVVCINRTIAYSQMLFVQSEYPDVSVSKSLKASIAMTKGHRADLFLLNLSFIGWMILAPFTLYIGLLWIIPYIQTTHAAAYQFLKQKAFENGLLAKAQNEEKL
jgi:uncharacterized membrane protein